MHNIIIIIIFFGGGHKRELYYINISLKNINITTTLIVQENTTTHKLTAGNWNTTNQSKTEETASCN